MERLFHFREVAGELPHVAKFFGPKPRLSSRLVQIDELN